ncbi:ABC transporter ATP-binding protein [Rhizobium leguminosarum]|uniref:ABC transporter ATP-binding protein n=1 Tax=Rhizobium leguminosarum TaxID=384 RepID=UPI001DD64BB2|nr:ABC transporter ATP-binding protein [Rhizobium leguminosarum]MBY2927029.1 ABC transporter ATP-binding protein [Rhizobium leguminosarum]MBY2937731.1 ABC transporter ATP-binding protein [Rhizobium leguminosarum]
MKMALKPVRYILTDYFSGSRLSILILLASILTGSALSVFVPYYFSRQLDLLATGASTTQWLRAFWVYAILLGISVTFQRGTQYLAVIQAERLGFLASRSFFDRLIAKRPSFFVDHNPAEIQSAQSQGTQAITMLVQVAFIAFLPGAASFGLTIIMLGAVINLQIVLVVLTNGMIFLTLIVISNRVGRRYMEAAIDAGQANARYVGNAISVIEPLRQAGSVRWMKDRFTDSAESVFLNWRAYAVRRIGFAGLVGVSITLQFGVTFFLLLPRYEAGTLSIGDVVLFNILLLQLNVPFELIGQSIDETLRAITKMGPLARIWSEPEEEDLGDRETLVLSRGTLEFRDVGYRYPNGRGATNISFKAERGRVTFITGETGSGKSTLFKLLLKAIEPNAGAIRIDGKNLNEIPRTIWFAKTGIVPQEVLLLNDSLKTNITMGRALDEARLKEAARKAAILSRIEEMPEGFETTVGERGLKLSGGERQRIAIARALYRAPSILLLDEASSALDDTTEAEIMDQLRLIGGDMTIIAITHRLSSIQPGDQVVELRRAAFSKQ